MADLTKLGWDASWQETFREHDRAGRKPARVRREERGQYWLVTTADGDDGAALIGEVAGTFRHRAAEAADYPTVGDWVAITHADLGGERAIIHAVLPRRTQFSRKRKGTALEEQVIVANADVALVVTGLDGDFSVRRIERYLTAAWQSGTTPVVVLNKADLAEDLDGALAEAEEVAYGAPVVATSATTGEGIAAILAHLGPGKTAVLLGSSGVGKSTLVNQLLGETRLATAPVREADSRGRHTTSWREMILLPGGGLIIDTPGMREFAPWADIEAADEAFGDVEELAAACRFRDCSHEGEPGCAVQEALMDGRLLPDRYDAWLAMRKELTHLERQRDIHIAHNNKRKWKQISKWARRLNQDRDRGD